MSIIDAREPGLPAAIDCNICIVGAGAAGITLAHRLSDAGVDVCVIESGGLAPDPETQALYDLESTGYPLRPDYMSRARYFGGSCNLWAGRSMTLNRLDFERRSWVPHSGWPIPYDAVARYYPRALEILDLPAPDRVTPEFVDAHLSADERRLFAGGVLASTLSLWARSAKRFGSSYLPVLRRARNVRVVLHASVTQIALNDGGSAVSTVVAMTPTGGRLEVRARRYVLACGGLENARLLLASRDCHTTGIANQHDLVGRFFMDHPRTVFGRVHLPAGIDMPMFRGRPLRDGKLQVGIGPAPETQRRESLLNHFVTLEHETSGFVEAKYQSLIQTMKVVLRRGYSGSRWDFARAHLSDIPNMIYLLSPKELMPHWLYRLFVAMREAVPRRPHPKTYVAVYFCEQPPDPASRVTLARATDRLGVQKLSLHWHLGDAVRDGVLRVQELLGDELKRTGVGHLERAQEPPAFTDASHHMGTTRMSQSPREGVVNTDCRVHGVENLYVAGSSVFPCAGHANPTLTIVALALRLADLLQDSRA